MTLAIALRPEKDEISPVQIDLYEAGAEITTVGAGISVWTRTWEIMRELGLYEDLAAQSVRTGSGTKDYSEGNDDGKVKLSRSCVLSIPFCDRQKVSHDEQSPVSSSASLTGLAKATSLGTS